MKKVFKLKVPEFKKTIDHPAKNIDDYTVQIVDEKTREVYNIYNFIYDDINKIVKILVAPKV